MQYKLNWKKNKSTLLILNAIVTNKNNFKIRIVG